MSTCMQLLLCYICLFIMFMHVLGFVALFISYCSTSCELCIFLKCRITCRLAVGPVCSVDI